MGVPALIVAAGSGQRLGTGQPKALAPLEDRPLYVWSVEAFLHSNAVDRVLVAVPPGHAGYFSAPGIEIVEGGDSRSESVANGLASLGEDAGSELIVVHDAARPLVTPQLIDAAVEALESAPDLDAVVAAAPVTDTIKRVGDQGRVAGTLDRSELVSVQTPQVFRIDVLRQAIAAGDLARATDDASLVEAAGGTVGVIDSPSSNIKVTVPGDLELAAYFLRRHR